MKMICKYLFLINFYVCALDDFSPLNGFGFHIGREFIGRGADDFETVGDVSIL